MGKARIGKPKQVIAACDNGLDGAIVLMTYEGMLWTVTPMPTFDEDISHKKIETPHSKRKRKALRTKGVPQKELPPRVFKDKKRHVSFKALLQIFDRHRITKLFIEKPSGGQNANALVSMHVNYTKVCCAAAANKVKPIPVNALEWQKTFWTAPKKGDSGYKEYDTKKEALKALEANFTKPEIDRIPLSPVAGNFHDGCVDAALIARWAMNGIKGELK